MNSISRKKANYPITPQLSDYLKRYNRASQLPITYSQLKEYAFAIPVYDKRGVDTLWESVTYAPEAAEGIMKGLKSVYALLKTQGDEKFTEHLDVDRIDYCTFGNSHPFRIRIINRFNDNYDYFYIKTADASRIYGLELEHTLSPNRISYYIDNDTLVEEHIVGIPADLFVTGYLSRPETNPTRIAKEFVKFNERCFVRLLGDMRAYNYVVDITPDFDAIQYRLRAIDFDQQCYEGRKNLYLPQFYKENKAFVDLCSSQLNENTIAQYQSEERSLIARRVKNSGNRLPSLLEAMKQQPLSTPEKIAQLGAELTQHYNDAAFTNAPTMGHLVELSLQKTVHSL